jgi:hypothetical protein
MSEKMLIIHSDTIKGAGLFQCWPYGVGFYDELKEEGATKESLSAHSIQDIDAAAAANQIDATENLASRSVYIYSG